MASIDLVGKKFGRLTVLEKLEVTRNGSFWLCKCDCGATKEMLTGNIKRKDYVPTCGSCWDNLPEQLSGYSFSELPFMSTAKDYTGITFSKVKVNGLSRRDRKSKVTYWDCTCLICEKSFEKSTGSITDSINSNRFTCCGCTYYKKPDIESAYKEMFRRYKKGHSYRKKKQNKEEYNFELTYEDFREIISKPCTYCGLESDVYNVREWKLYCNGIDRIDSDKGYTKDNITTCCKVCNRAKNKMSLEEWNTWLDRISKFRLLGDKHAQPEETTNCGTS